MYRYIIGLALLSLLLIMLIGPMGLVAMPLEASNAACHLTYWTFNKNVLSRAHFETFI